jgi:PAS domain S-box-containing protein
MPYSDHPQGIAVSGRLARLARVAFLLLGLQGAIALVLGWQAFQVHQSQSLVTMLVALLEAGAVTGLVGVVYQMQRQNRQLQRQVIQQQQAIEQRVIAQHQAQTQVRVMLEAFSDLLFHVAADGTYLDCCTGDANSLNLPVEQFIGQTMQDVLPDSVSRQAYESLQTALATQSCQSLDYSLLMSDGLIHDYTARLIPQPDQSVYIVVRDVSDRQQAQRALQYSQDRYSLATEAGQVGVWDWYLETGEMYIDPVLKAMLGYQDGDIVNHIDGWGQYVFADDQPKVQRAVADFLAGRTQRFDVEHRMVHRNGEIRWMLARGIAIRDDAGKVYRMTGTDTDISDRKRAELALQESEQRFRAVFEQAAVGIAWANRDGVFLDVNQHYCEITGYSKAELIGRQFRSITHPDDVDIDCAFTRQLFNGERESFAMEKRYIRPDGTVEWVYMTSSLVRDSNGSPLYELVVVVDISDRKRAEMALRRNEERFHQFAENFQAVFWIYDPIAQRQLYVSPAFESIWGRKPQELLEDSQLLFRSIHPSDRPLVEQAIKQGYQGLTYTMEYRILRPDGSIRWIYDRGFSLKDEQGELYQFAGIAEDITERKKAETEIQQLVQREQALSSVIRSIRNSLDLKTIFSTAVAQITDLLALDQVLIVQFQASEDNWVHVAEYHRLPDQPSTLGLRIPNADNPLAQQLHRFETVKIQSTTALEDPIHRELSQQFPGRCLLVPIQVSGHLWGSLTVLHHDTDLQWQPEEERLAEVLADQLAIAIYQSELYTQIQNFNRSLEQQVRDRTLRLERSLEFEALLNRITDKVRDSLDESQILSTVVRELADVLEIFSCDTGMYDLDAQTSTILYEWVRSPLVPSAQGKVVPMDCLPEIYGQLLQGRYLQFCNNTRMNSHVRPVLDQFSKLVYPLIDDQGVLGDLWLYRDCQHCFEEAEIRLVQQVAKQCAIAIRQSRLYQEAQRQVQALERLNRLKDDFLSTVSHELRTPMSNIKMTIQMLDILLHRHQLLGDSPLTDMAADHTSIERYVHILQEECDREITLINDLLDLSRMDAEIEPLLLSTIDLKTWLPYIAEPFIYRTQAQSQQFILDIPDHLPSLTTDFNDLEKIVTELLQNACKYTTSGESIRVELTTHLESQNTANHTFVIHISNSGVFIPASELIYIFDKFYRVPNHDPWKHGGTGLGLALAKKRVERLKGRIDVLCQDNWITFSVYLPLNCPLTPHDRVAETSHA